MWLIMEEERRVTHLLLNPENGEIVREIFEGDVFIPFNRYESELKNNSQNSSLYRYVDDEKYYFVNYKDYEKFDNKCKKVLSKLNLTSNEFRIFLFLTSYIEMNSNAIVHKNGKEVTKKFVAKELKVSESVVSKAFTKLKDEEIIEYSTVGGRVKIFFNYHIIMRGSYANKTLVRMFQHSKWQNISEIEI